MKRRPRVLTVTEKYQLLLYHDGILDADDLKRNLARDNSTRHRKYNNWIRYHRKFHPQKFVQ